MQIANGFEWTGTSSSGIDSGDSPSQENRERSEKGKFEIN